MTNKQSSKLDRNQKASIAVTLLAAGFILFTILRYWYADTLYAKGKILNRGENQDPKASEKILLRAIAISPNQPLYHLELSESYTSQAISGNDKAKAELAISESQRAIDLSPKNVNLIRARFTTFIRLTLMDPKYLTGAIKALEDALVLAPTDAKLYYNLGLSLVRAGQNDEALDILKRTIELKANYRDARLAYALLLIEKGEKEEARKHLEYILKFIEPGDTIAKQTLEEIK